MSDPTTNMCDCTHPESEHALDEDGNPTHCLTCRSMAEAAAPGASRYFDNIIIPARIYDGAAGRCSHFIQRNPIAS